MSKQSIFRPCSTTGHRRGANAQGGGTLIEFALILPLILLILGGAFSLEELMYEKRMLSEASYVATIAAARMPSGTTPQDLRDTTNTTIDQFLTDAGINTSDFAWRIDPISSATPGLPNSVKLTIGPRNPTRIKVFGYNLNSTVCSTSTTMLAESNSVLAFDTFPDC